MLDIKENEPLSKHSTYKIGGQAKYFVVVKTKDDILEAIDFARQKKLSFFLSGGGSNILFSDKGYNGVIIKIQLGGFKIDGCNITAEGGVPLSQLVSASIDNHLTGLEWGVGIPGTIGGAVNGNAGAYGKSISDNIEGIVVLGENGKEKRYLKEECDFKYRRSKFKKIDNKEIIVEVCLKLEKGDKEKSREQIKDILTRRKGKIPPQPSAGCVFKNIKSENGRLVAAVGSLVEQCGLKGQRVGGAEIPMLHGNYIVNAGGATAKDVAALINLCKQKVKEKFNIDLEEEIVVV